MINPVLSKKLYCEEDFNFTLFSSLIFNADQIQALSDRINELKNSGVLIGDLNFQVTTSGYTQIYANSAVRLCIDGIDCPIYNVVKPLLLDNQYARIVLFKSDRHGVTMKSTAFNNKGLISYAEEKEKSIILFELQQRGADLITSDERGLIMPLSGIPFEKGYTKQYLFSTKLKIASGKAFKLMQELKQIPLSYSCARAKYCNNENKVHLSGQSTTLDDFSTMIVNRSKHLHRVSELLYQNCTQDQTGDIYMVSITPTQTLLSIEHIII